MEQYDLYRDIAARCGGTLFVGVTGPVRTGKSTLITRMMQQMVLQSVPEGPEKQRMIDELPQSGSGKTIMTTQPSFVPSQPVFLPLEGGDSVQTRFVDCVGYVVDGAFGATEDGKERKVQTPWDSEPMEFSKAAELGTNKVIDEHAGILLVVTTDGSFTEIPHQQYALAEKQAILAVKKSGKPFAVVMNSATPWAEESKALAKELEKEYDVPVLVKDVLHLDREGLSDILGEVLSVFPIRQIHVSLPGWMEALPEDDPLVKNVLSGLQNNISEIHRMRDVDPLLSKPVCEDAQPLNLLSKALGTGEITLSLPMREGLFYEVLGQKCGQEIKSDAHLMSMMTELVTAKREYDRVKEALFSVRETGYGLVPPSMEELRLEEPQVIRKGGEYGVRLRATAPSLHLIRVDIATEVSPTIGSEKESEEMLKYLLTEFESDPQSLWNTDIFGKSLHDLMREGLSGKLLKMPEDAQNKTRETLSRIINEGSGGMICILL